MDPLSPPFHPSQDAGDAFVPPGDIPHHVTDPSLVENPSLAATSPHSPPQHSPQVQHPARTIFVGGFSSKVNERDLLHFFSHHGKVLECKVIVDRSNKKSKGYGFVTFEDERVAEDLRQRQRLPFQDNKQINICSAYRKEHSIPPPSTRSHSPSQPHSHSGFRSHDRNGSGNGGGNGGRHKKGMGSFSFPYGPSFPPLGGPSSSSPSPPPHSSSLHPHPSSSSSSSSSPSRQMPPFNDDRNLPPPPSPPYFDMYSAPPPGFTYLPFGYVPYPFMYQQPDSFPPSDGRNPFVPVYYDYHLAYGPPDHLMGSFQGMNMQPPYPLPDDQTEETTIDEIEDSTSLETKSGETEKGGEKSPKTEDIGNENRINKHPQHQHPHQHQHQRHPHPHSQPHIHALHPPPPHLFPPHPSPPTATPIGGHSPPFFPLLPSQFPPPYPPPPSFHPLPHSSLPPSHHPQPLPPHQQYPHHPPPPSTKTAPRGRNAATAATSAVPLDAPLQSETSESSSEARSDPSLSSHADDQTPSTTKSGTPETSLSSPQQHANSL